MTTAQAIEQIKMMLDERGVENYSDVEVLLALEQAQQMKAREYFFVGRKRALDPLFVRITLTGSGASGIDISALADRYMLPQACLVRLLDNGGTFRHAIYIKPEQYLQYVFANPGSGTISGRLNYTVAGNMLLHNGAGNECEFAYYKLPTIPTPTTQLLLHVSSHGAIVDTAAQLLYKKDSGTPDQLMVGSIADTVQLTQQRLANGQG